MSKNDVRDKRSDGNKGTYTVLCLHCNAYTACDELSVLLLLSLRLSSTSFLLINIHFINNSILTSNLLILRINSKSEN